MLLLRTPRRETGALARQAATGADVPLSLRPERFVVEHARGEGVGRLTHDDAHGRGDRLQARGDVDGVADEQTLPGAGFDVEPHERLAGVDADADPARLPADARHVGEPFDEAQPGAHGALGVVLVRDRHAEGPTTASPMNFSTVPPCASITLRATAW